MCHFRFEADLDSLIDIDILCVVFFFVFNFPQLRECVPLALWRFEIEAPVAPSASEK